MTKPAPCCERDTDGDGNCPDHPRGISRPWDRYNTDPVYRMMVDCLADYLRRGYYSRDELREICTLAIERNEMTRRPQPVQLRRWRNSAISMPDTDAPAEGGA